MGQAVLELRDHLGLRGDHRLGVLGLLLELELLAQRDLGEVVEPVGVDGVARGAQLVGLGRGGDGLGAPLGGGGDVLGVVGLGQAQVADRDGDRVLGLGDRVRVVPDHLVEHLLGVLGAVEQGVDVRLGQLGDAPEDGLLLGHGWCLPVRWCAVRGCRRGLGVGAVRSGPLCCGRRSVRRRRPAARRGGRAARGPARGAPAAAEPAAEPPPNPPPPRRLLCPIRMPPSTMDSRPPRPPVPPPPDRPACQRCTSASASCWADCASEAARWATPSAAAGSVALVRSASWARRAASASRVRASGPTAPRRVSMKSDVARTCEVSWPSVVASWVRARSSRSASWRAGPSAASSAASASVRRCTRGELVAALTGGRRLVDRLAGGLRGGGHGRVVGRQAGGVSDVRADRGEPRVELGAGLGEVRAGVVDRVEQPDRLRHRVLRGAGQAHGRRPVGLDHGQALRRRSARRPPAGPAPGPGSPRPSRARRAGTWWPASPGRRGRPPAARTPPGRAGASRRAPAGRGTACRGAWRTPRPASSSGLVRRPAQLQDLGEHRAGLRLGLRLGVVELLAQGEGPAELLPWRRRAPR